LVSVWHIDLGPAAIAQLRERYREGATVEELAREAGCSVGTMRLALG
jgi:AcrR family transcriptional regulator